MIRFALVFALGFAVACDLFPRDLIDADGGTGDGSVSLPLSETCVSDVPMVTAGTNAEFDLSSFADDVSAVAGCTGETTPGGDGFFGVEMAANEKWHFHVRNTSGSGFDPAIYVLDSACDARRCGPTDGIDRCAGNRDEHLTFVAPRAGVFYVGLDSKEAGGGSYELLVIRPECGDGNVEHSETCDDMNTESGDGCDSQCRVELSAGARSEEEPNDDFTGANVVPADGLDVDGQLTSECDVDLFVVDVTTGNVNVDVLGVGGVVCSDPGPALDLRLWNEDATSVRAVGTVEDGNACPVLRATGLSAGEHLISIATTEERPVSYVLRISSP